MEVSRNVNVREIFEAKNLARVISYIKEKVISLALIESLHKRITYLKGEKIITLSDYAKKSKKTAPALFNAAKRQNIPAFREKGVWKIGECFKY